MDNSSGYLLELRGVTKHYPGVIALNKVNFNLLSGEVHALMGENGAGKSTLIKSLLGIAKMDEGEILLNGVKTKIKDAHDACKKGISAVFQELSLIPYLNIADNVFLNREIKKGVLIDKNTEIEKTQSLINKYGFSLNAKEFVSKISAAQRQICEITKAISTGPKIIIFDEPTSSLTEREADLLFNIIGNFKKNGAGIIYVSHRMNEIFRLADRVTVLRDGEYIATENIRDIDMDKVVSMMVGRKVDFGPKELHSIDYNTVPLLEVRNINNGKELKDINFKLYAGEILGIAGLVGSGRSEIMNMIFGVDPIKKGEILIDGKPVGVKDVKSAISNHIALLPESRHQQGLVLIHNIKENITLPILKRFQNGLFKNKKLENTFAQGMVQRLDIKTNSVNKIVSQLSGGNQQKVVVAKWLSTKPRIFIIDEPTAGVDVAAKFEIHKILRQYVQEQKIGIVMISSEMPELLRYSDRVLVVNNHRIIKELTGHFEQEAIMSEIMNDNARTASLNQ